MCYRSERLSVRLLNIEETAVDSQPSSELSEGSNVIAVITVTKHLLARPRRRGRLGVFITGSLLKANHLSTFDSAVPLKDLDGSNSSFL